MLRKMKEEDQRWDDDHPAADADEAAQRAAARPRAMNAMISLICGWYRLPLSGEASAGRPPKEGGSGGGPALK